MSSPTLPALFISHGAPLFATDAGESGPALTRLGQQLKQLAGGSLPGTSYEQSRAYTNYIRRLQSGTSGFTCFASLQMPRG